MLIATMFLVSACATTRQPALDTAVQQSEPLTPQELEKKEFWERMSKKAEQQPVKEGNLSQAEETAEEADEALSQAEETAEEADEAAFDNKDRTEDIEKPLKARDRQLQKKINSWLYLFLALPFP